MFSQLAKNPAALAVELTAELAKRGKSLDLTDLDALRTWTDYAVSSAYYCTRAKALLTQPLRDRKIDYDGSDWHACGVKLYGLWQRMRPAEVEKRMTQLRAEAEGRWSAAFPDEWNIDEQKLLSLYKSGGELLMNSTHDWSDLSLALRYYATQILATASDGRGFFDWGGSDGISCIFAAHHGARDVHLHEPNAANRAFGQWLSSQLALPIAIHETDPIRPGAPPPRQFGAGMCTEVLEHVVNPPRMMGQFYELLHPGGVMFVTSSFGVPQDTHLRQNLKYAGRESELMVEAGFRAWEPPVPRPMPFLPQWGFWQKPG